MTLKEVIDAYSADHSSNPYDSGKLTGMVTALDRMVQEKMLHTFPFVLSIDPDTGEIIKTAGTLVTYAYDTDQEKELLLSGTPYEDLYSLYLPAMVSFKQEDWMKYQNKKNMYNARYMEALAYFAKNYQQIQTDEIHNYW